MQNRVRLSDVVGVMVISREEGAHLGFLERIFIDPKRCALSAITFRHSRLSGERAVAAGAVVGFGRDVVVIENEKAAVPVEDLTEESTLALRDFRGRWVTTQQGERLGTLVDMTVSDEGWRIAELHLLGKNIPVIADDLVVGKDELLVPPAYADKVEMTDEAQIRPEILGRLTEAVRAWTRWPAARAVARVTTDSVRHGHDGEGAMHRRASRSRPRHDEGSQPAA